jgi:RIO-like serine/threonine protein kinase
LVATWRESGNYHRLAGLEGIPAFGGRIDRYALAVEFIPGRNADRFRRGDLPASFFDELHRIVTGVHGRGVVLADLRNSKNIMVTEQWRPVLIDFSTAFSRGQWWNPVQRWLYGVFERDDYLGIAKLKRRYAPELMTEEERGALERGLPLEGPAHAVRDAFKKSLKWLFGPGRR